MSLCQADGVGPPYRHRVRNGRQHGDLSGEQRFMGMEHDELQPPQNQHGTQKLVGWVDVSPCPRGCRHFGGFEWLELEKLEASE